MKILIICLLFALPVFGFSKAEDYFVLDKDKNCWVKHYQDKKFTDADPKKFYGIRLFAKPHKKDTRYSVFKYSEKIYVVKSSCLNPISIQSGDFEDLIDSEVREDDKYVNRATRSTSFAEGLRFDENQWYIELDVGKVSIGDKNQIYPNYDELDGTYGSDTFDFKKPLKESYETKSAISLGGGYQLSDGTFLAFRVKHFKGSKKEIVPVTITNLGIDGESEFKYEDSFTSFLVGGKFIFWPEYKLKPVLSVFGGINQISSTLTLPTESDTKLKTESIGLSAMAEAGFEFLFTNNFGISLTGGYEYLGQRTFKLKGEDDSEDTVKGYKTKMSYSNTFVNFGIRIYFR